MNTPRYEKATDELRQVTGSQYGSMGDFVYVIAVQRKWLVQDGESFYYPTQPSSNAVQTGPWHPLAPNIGFHWTIVKPVWRDLPTVTESEARHS